MAYFNNLNINDDGLQSNNSASSFGESVAEGIADGLKNKSVSNKIRDFKNTFLASIKDAFKIREYSDVTKDEVGKYLSLGIASGLSENSKFVIKAFEGMLEKLKYQRDFDIISEEEYYRQLEILRDKYFTKGSENWVKYTKEIYEYQKKTLEVEKENILNLYDDITNYAEKKLDEVIKKQNKVASELGSGVLFTKNTVYLNDEVGTYYSLFDFENDIKMIEEYTNMLTRLREKFDSLGILDDAGKTILSELNKMSTEDAYGYMSAILTSSDSEILSYAQNLLLKQSLSSNAASTQFQDEFNSAWADSLDNMKTLLKEAGYQIPEEFSLSGSVSAEKFGEAFIEELELQLEGIRGKIEEFNANLSTTFDESQAHGNIYNTNNTSYNINASDNLETVELIKRFETVKRLSGV